MWFIIDKDKNTMTEEDLIIWDSIPKDREILKVGFMLSDKLPPLLLPVGERYCITRTARNTLNGQEITGYVLLSDKKGVCSVLNIKKKLITFGFRKTHMLKIRENAWRVGVI